MASKKMLVAIALIGGMLSGCVSGGKTYKDIEASIPPLSGNNGRIFFFRLDELLSMNARPNITLNGEVVGTVKSGAFFFVDRPAGDYKVAITTEVENKVEFHLKAGETKYVKTMVALGIVLMRFEPSVTPPLLGASHVKELIYSPD